MTGDSLVPATRIPLGAFASTCVRQAAWRRTVAEKNPGDTRNLRCADALDALARWVTENAAEAEVLLGALPPSVIGYYSDVLAFDRKHTRCSPVTVSTGCHPGGFCSIRIRGCNPARCRSRAGCSQTSRQPPNGITPTA